MIDVVLNPKDLAWAREVGQARIDMAPGNPRFAYVQRSGIDTHTIGAMAELALARGLSIPWPAHVNTFRSKPDLEPLWEVRWSSALRRVKVAADDPPEYLVCHVTGEPPHFQIHGYIVAGWVQRNTPLVDLGNRGWAAYFTRIEKLTPLEPGSHDTHPWWHGPKGWICLFCGEPFEKEAP